jgi:rare lipoprotein A
MTSKRSTRSACLVIVAAVAAITASPTAALAHDGVQCGKASWYALNSRTASGERMNPSGLSAAHRTLPFGTKVKVENLRNGRSVVVRINDRGPFIRSRVIDVSKGAAQELGFVSAGVASVRVSVVGERGDGVAQTCG